MPSTIGKIILNLLNLEFHLRLFLYEMVGPKDPTLKLENLKIGDWIPANPITNYDSIGGLINQVNKVLLDHKINEKVDNKIVDVRNALVHGRITALYPTGPLHLIKYSKLKNEKVQVEISLDLTKEWLNENINLTMNEIKKIRKISHSLGLACFPDD